MISVDQQKYKSQEEKNEVFFEAVKRKLSNLNHLRDIGILHLSQWPELSFMLSNDWYDF